MKQNTININGKAYQIGFSFKAIREFETIAKKSITECTGTWDNILFFYATLTALNEGFEITFEQFIEYLDADPNLLIQFQHNENDRQTTNPTPEKKSFFGLWMLSLLLLVLPIFLPIISGISFLYLSLKLLARPIAKIGKKRASPS
jgi:hypothetical protein